MEPASVAWTVAAAHALHDASRNGEAEIYFRRAVSLDPTVSPIILNILVFSLTEFFLSGYFASSQFGRRFTRPGQIHRSPKCLRKGATIGAQSSADDSQFAPPPQHFKTPKQQEPKSDLNQRVISDFVFIGNSIRKRETGTDT